MTSGDRDGPAMHEELERILASSGFARNERLSRFLRFLVEQHLDGKDDEIKETSIAVEVFGRRPDYDPRVDSIVRTEAGRLRARLTEYYAGEGRGAAGLIEIPKGAYVPVFRQVPVLDPPITRLRWWPRAAVWALLAAGVAVVGWWQF